MKKDAFFLFSLHHFRSYEINEILSVPEEVRRNIFNYLAVV